MTLIFRLIIRRDIWIFHSKVFSSGSLSYSNYSYIRKHTVTMLTEKQLLAIKKILTPFKNRIVNQEEIVSICNKTAGRPVNPRSKQYLQHKMHHSFEKILQFCI